MDLDILSGSHTGKNLALSFWRSLQRFDIIHKVMAITTDNAANCDTFFNELGILFQSQVHSN